MEQPVEQPCYCDIRLCENNKNIITVYNKNIPYESELYMKDIILLI